MYSLNIDIEQFLNTHWQKQPIVFRQAFNDFKDIITAEELAGLACEQEVSSRVVLTKKADNKPTSWEVVHGPFEDYGQFGEDHWQLLVQAVNHWHSDSRELVEAFRFLPDWRFDDLMVSFATPKGGVGPHIDNYDVFIIQGEGRRRWTVGDIGQYQPRDNDPSSPLIEDFEPIIDIVMEAGDILYIPPGYPHRGETLTKAISYSIGFRAPSQQELFSQIADHLLDANLGQKRFISRDENTPAGQVSQTHQAEIMALVAELANEPSQYQSMLGKLLSQNRFELDIYPDEPITATELTDALAQGAALSRLDGVKLIQLQGDLQKRLFINGDEIATPELTQDEMNQLCQQLYFTHFEAITLCQSHEVQILLTELINQGLFYLSEAQ